ncbi:alginate O-acetyltransferase AlgX-related protein [Deinococcus alpinitundrae]|uniref:alginate O-acetyltransferase AlgX-related protein n=1 Tax=Deinococcus alpinitundrae TaxID=468913 RepID=UPI00137A97FE|nr:hypothetical protein [Deinococcus alpinitundrae]
MISSKCFPLAICAALLFASPGLAQTAVPEVCTAATEKPPYVVSDGQGRLYSQLTLGTDFSAATLVPDLRELERRLQNLGIELVVVPVPWAAMLYFPESLVGTPGTFHYSPLLARLGYWQVIENFRKAGINIIDLLTPFLAHQTQDLYFKTDHHWKLPAVELAARSVTDAVPRPVKQALATVGQPEEVPPVFQGRFQFLGGFAVPVERLCKFTFPSEETFATIALPEPSQNLISDDLPGGVIFGSSFSRSVTTNQGINPYALGYGFEQWLISLLHTDFQNESISGGSETSMLELFGDPANVAKRRLAIWEFPISDFATENKEHNQTFLAQMMARLSRLSNPVERPVASGRPVVTGNEVVFSFDPLPSTGARLYFQLKLGKATALSPVVKIEGERGTAQLDLRRDGNKLIQAKEFLAEVPVNVGRLRQITVTFPTSTETPVVLNDGVLQLFNLK